MSDVRQCKRCGAELKSFALGRLCPRCMLESGLTEPTEGSLEGFEGASLRHFGDYELLEELGRGGMGVVFKARQISLNRLVALKLILAGRLASESILRRFYTEAEAAARLEHPNIVSIYQIGEEQGQRYFSMRLVEGSNLAALLRSSFATGTGTGTVPKPAAGTAALQSSWFKLNGPRDRARWAAGLMVKVARAVHYAHERGILHRDLKPANILIDSRDEPYVADFGLARILEENSDCTLSETVLGTPAYMAPEQATGGTRQVTTAADVFSLGAVLYEILAGRQPFSGDTPLEIMRQTADAEPRRLRALNANVDRDLETICLKCLEKNPSCRYGSAEALAEDLERWLGNEPIAARPVGRIAQVRKWVRRKPLVAGLTGSVIALFVIGLAGVLSQWHRAERRGRDLALNVYAAEMQLALQSWEERNTANALRLLEKHRNAPWRGFEWRYLRQLSEGALATLPINGNYVSEVAFSTDGKLLVSAEHKRGPGATHSIGIWDASSFTRRGAIPLPLKPQEVWWIGGFTFLEGGTVLAADGNDGIIRRWDLNSQKENLLLPEKTRGSWPPRLSPDGRWLVGVFRKGANRSYTIRVFETESGAEAGSRDAVLMAGGFMNDHKVRCSPDGRLLAVASRPDVVRIFSLPGLEESAVLKVIREPEVVAFSSGSDLLAVGGVDQAVQVWNIREKKVANTLLGKLKAPSSDLCFSADGTQLAASTDDSVITVWDVRSGLVRAEFQGHAGKPSSIAYSPDGTLLASGGERDGTVRIWKVPSASVSPLQKSRTNGFWRVVFSPDARLLAATTADAGVELFDTATEQSLGTLTSANKAGDATLSFTVRDLPAAFSPDGKLLAVGNGNRTASVWDVETRREIHVLTNHTSFVNDVAFSPDGKTLLTTSADKNLRFWDVSSGALQSTIKAARALRFATKFSPDGNLLVYSGSLGVLTVWDVRRRETVRSWPASNREIFAVAFSPDGRTLASSSEEAVKLWDLRNGSEVATFDGRHGQPFSLMFTPDGRNLIAPEVSGYVRLWHLPSLREAGTLKAPTGLVSAALSSDGNVLATCSVEGGVRLFKAASWLESGEPRQGK